MSNHDRDYITKWDDGSITFPPDVPAGVIVAEANRRGITLPSIDVNEVVTFRNYSTTYDPQCKDVSP